MSQLEHKSYLSIELKAEADTGSFSGYAATYAKDSDGDRIEPGAFAQSIKDRKGQIPIFLQHDRQQFAGLSTGMAEDGKGLWIEAQLFLDTSIGKDAWGILKACKSLDYRIGLSIGFITKQADWEDATATRILKEIEVWETSITPFPANRQARVDSIKSLGSEAHIYTAIRELIAGRK